MRELFFVILIAGLIGLLDQLSKFLVLQELSYNDPVEVIEGVFYLRLVNNPGAAFSMFADFPSPWRQISLGVSSVLALWLVTHMLLSEGRENRLLRFALSLVLGGAIGNLIDRVRLGVVIDFLEVYLGSYPWPVFNLADSAISLGIALLVLDMWLKRKTGKPSKES